MNPLLISIVVLLWLWIIFEYENAPMYVESEDTFYYKDHITFFGIKICKDFRKNN